MIKWKQVKNYEDLYHISNDGLVKSLNRNVFWGYGKQRIRVQKESILIPGPDSDGYLMINLCRDGKKKHVAIHRLVAEHFISNPDSLPHVNHKDGNHQNNHYSNLEWCTSKDNTLHAFATGLCYSKFKRSGLVRKHLTQEEIEGIRNVTGQTNKQIAEKYGVSRKTISRVKNYKTVLKELEKQLG